MHTHEIELPLLRDIVANPSGLDSMANYLGEIPDESWLCLMTRTRDSNCLTESNWRVALRELGGESENVEVFHFGHWACGWWEALAVKDGSDQSETAREIHASIHSYPVLDEEDFSNLEEEEAGEVWMNCYSERERLEYIKKNRWQFEFNSLGDMISCVKGKFFGGIASELIH